MRNSLSSGLLLFAIAWSSTATGAPIVGIVLDEECQSCSASVQPGVPLQAYVVLTGWSLCTHCVGSGLVEVEFKLDGVPASWTRSYLASPLATYASDPFSSAGATIQFRPALGDVPDCLILYTLLLVPTADTSERLSASEHPYSICPPGSRGPSVCIGSGGLCLVDCQPGGFAYLDGTPCVLTDVLDRTWGDLKRAYE